MEKIIPTLFSMHKYRISRQNLIRLRLLEQMPKKYHEYWHFDGNIVRSRYQMSNARKKQSKASINYWPWLIFNEINFYIARQSLSIS